MAELLKDRFFTPQFIDYLCNAIRVHFPAFDGAAFKNGASGDQWEGLELKARMRHLSHLLHDQLPADFARAMEILEAVAPAFNGFDGMLFPDYVEVYGLEHRERSLSSLTYLTRFSSSEFAIRPFLLDDLPGTMDYLQSLAGDANYHVRRFASEGCRPRLPWAVAIPALKKDPSPILPILEALNADGEDYVRRSVANNLNDISKDHPDLVLEIAERWHGNHKHSDWIVKHACRGLLKSGNQQAMRIFGFGDPDSVEISELKIEPQTPEVGGNCFFSFRLTASEDINKLRLEYKINFVRKSGGFSTKVFQIGEMPYAAGEHHLQRNHSFRDLTTRKHYPGTHRLEITANGIPKAAISFELLAQS